MAQIYITVPDYWPDFVVTSYERNDGGSHSTHTAIDIAITGIADKSPGSKYWYYYIQTVIWLWAAQRRGVVRFAAPPKCPHFHIEDTDKKFEVGFEFISYNAQLGCHMGKDSYVKSWPANQVGQLISNMRKSSIMQAYIASFLNFYREIGVTLSSHPRYLQVKSNGAIGERDLQNKLVNIFGDGTVSQRIKDKAARLVGYMNADEAPDLLMWAGMAGGAYLLYQIAKEARYWHANKPTN